MKRTFWMLALAGVSVGTSGCCCCRDWFAPRAVAAPAPVMAAPACPPACDPCATPGVPYASPGAVYAPGPAYVPQM